MDANTLGHQKNTGDVVCASCNDVFPRGAPSEVVDLHRCATGEDGQHSNDESEGSNVYVRTEK
jgi:hypothetical protein